ncbi:MAG: hypothetical protein JXA54_06135 [Candidatus Heimdallarchaeota archaeon]|nr:hypothetical protein [Candidatus Heimdallarchaeota archaeon]
MLNNSPLENACKEILGRNYEEYYHLLSNLLLLNVDLIKRNDQRLSAKVTSILFDNQISNKTHTICEYIEAADWEYNFQTKELEDAKKLLELDPELKITKEIINHLKRHSNQNYSEIMRKVDIKNEIKLYRNRDGYTRSRI